MRLPVSYVKRVPPWLAACLGGLMLAGLAVGLLVRRSEIAEREQRAQEAYLEVCEGPRDQCERTIEEHHEVCFGANFKRGGRHTGPGFNDRGYLRCMNVGPDRFYRERRRERQRRQGERERLGLPPDTNL